MCFFRTNTFLAVRRMAAACILGLLRLFYFLPLKQRRVLLSEYGGKQYAGNVKCVSEYLRAQEGDGLELIWAFRHPKRFRDISGVKTVRYYSPAWFYYALTAHVVVTNLSSTRVFPKRRGQLFLNTWHGGGAYKRVGPMCFDYSKAQRRSRYRSMEKIDLYLSSSEIFTRFALREDLRHKGEILPCGMPRNDLFFSADRVAQASQKVRRALGVEGYVALYAPTFRGRKSEDCRLDYHFPFERVLAELRERVGGPVTILKRAHMGVTMLDEEHPGVLDVTDWPDMQELLCAADLLITDYSSSMWDFALLGRPCLLYVRDLDSYERERGICTPVEQWPGIACRSDEALLDAVKTFDERACGEKARAYLRACGSYETGTATEQTCRRIMEHIEGRRACAPGTGR